MDKLLRDMAKKFGEDNIIHEFGETSAPTEAIPTGIPSLDLATGVGGLPRGRITEIYGPEGAGKTTILLKAISEAQLMAGQMPVLSNKGEYDVKPLTGRAGILDVEHAISPSLLELHNVQTGKGSSFYFDQPMGGVEALDKLKMMVSSNLFDIIGVDSVAGLTTLEEDDDDRSAGTSVMASTARLMSQNLKSLVKLINKSRTAVVFINQIREKPAVQFGSPETTTGGRALKFYSSLRIRVSRGESISEGAGNVIGHNVKMDIKKNKMAPPFQKTTIGLVYKDTDKRKGGFDVFSDFITVGKQLGVIELSGSQYRFIDENGEIHKANGLVAFSKLLLDKPEVHTDIVKSIREVSL
ncbi:recombinase A [Bacillus phage vB_BpsS-140]|nr:recombinase A [Bacillus phage vB_BpsS-140]